MSIPQTEKTPEEKRQESIEWHCEMQQCVGCPKEHECDEADSKEFGVDCQEEDSYFGSDMQEDYP